MGKCLGHTIVNLVLADSMLMRISLYSRLFLVTSLRVTPEILQVLILARFSMRVGGWGRGADDVHFRSTSLCFYSNYFRGVVVQYHR